MIFLRLLAEKNSHRHSLIIVLMPLVLLLVLTGAALGQAAPPVYSTPSGNRPGEPIPIPIRCNS